MAECLKISASFVTNVLHKKAHLTFENIEELAKFIDLDELEMDLLFNKLIYAKADSLYVKNFFQKRINASLNSKNGSTDLSKCEKINNEDFFSNFLIFKLYSFIFINKHVSLQQVSVFLNIDVDQVEFLLLKMFRSPFNLEKKKIDGKIMYSVANSKNEFFQLKPNEKIEFSSYLRRYANYSLDLRQPELLNDYRQHYMTGSFLFKLNENQILLLKSKLKSFQEEILKLEVLNPGANESKIIGMTLDIFEMNF